MYAVKIYSSQIIMTGKNALPTYSKGIILVFIRFMTQPLKPLKLA